MADLSVTRALDEELLDTKQAAAILQVSPRTLERFRVEGGGPAYLKVGRRVLYDSHDIWDFLDRNRHSSTAEYAKRSECQGTGSRKAALAR